jgi:hypothetical protein
VSPEVKQRLDPEKRNEVCKDISSTRLKWAEDAWLNTRIVTFPGGFGGLSVGDLGVVGAFGMLLLLSWTFYAVRRENHALKSFVEEPPRRENPDRKRSFILRCTDDYLSPEHLVYAYQLISQRFVFLTSTYSPPLRGLTTVLFLLPLAVVACNLVSDVPAAITEPSPYFSLEFIHEAQVRVAIEALFLLGVTYFTVLIFMISASTARLLNAWSLAVRDVWVVAWDEEHPEPARPVLIDRHKQKAYLIATPAAPEPAPPLIVIPGEQ